MFYGVHRGVEHCALNEDLFLQKPISTDDLINNKYKVVNKKLNLNNNG